MPAVGVPGQCTNYPPVARQGSDPSFSKNIPDLDQFVWVGHRQALSVRGPGERITLARDLQRSYTHVDPRIVLAVQVSVVSDGQESAGNGEHFLSRRQVPDLDCPVLSCRRQPLPVGTPTQVEHHPPILPK